MDNVDLHNDDKALRDAEIERSDQQTTVIKKEIEVNTSIEDLQTDEQRRVLDTVAQVRKCGLEGVLSLPQLVVCGDQSAGKSSVLEALTEIPFPRSENLCTRFATEIILRRAVTNSLTIKIIPDDKRPLNEQTAIKAFKESITDFSELARVMDAAKAIMDKDASTSSTLVAKAFARDVLSIEIEGPTRPQLTLVDIPGLIHASTKGTVDADVPLVASITDQYIKQPRTICLAVVSAAYDTANQGILGKVREVDKNGDRTLGIITKPDLLPSGSGNENSFLELARNENIFFKLGWHVLKNRKFDEREFSLEERDKSEDQYFRTSNFKSLPNESLGIDNLRTRLSVLLFEHVKQELPKLRTDLEEEMKKAQDELQLMGKGRTSAAECKECLMRLSLEYCRVCTAAVEGHYEGDYFTTDADHAFSLTSEPTIRRIRAVVQFLNSSFAEKHRIGGHKYHVDLSDTKSSSNRALSEAEDELRDELSDQGLSPDPMTKAKAIEWVRSVLVRTRGRELVGNYNPLLVGELFWEQCSKWEKFAINYLDRVAEVCRRFLDILLKDKCPPDVVSRLRINLIQDKLTARRENAQEELDKIMIDVKNYPINYNHYYTETINKRRQDRQKKSLSKCIDDATTRTQVFGQQGSTSIDVDQALAKYVQKTDPNMEVVSCEEALDCLYAIYKVSHSYSLLKPTRLSYPPVSTNTKTI